MSFSVVTQYLELDGELLLGWAVLEVFSQLSIVSGSGGDADSDSNGG